MWWIPLIVILAIIILLIVLVVVTTHIHERGDYGDGGGAQVGGNAHVDFFTPANERAGIEGEWEVNHELRLLLRSDEYLLANLLIPVGTSFKTELDCVLISRKGIFCIETKYWVGTLIGNDDDEQWVQKYDDPTRPDRYHRNPIIQNEGHCCALEAVLDDRFNVTNIVIIVGYEDGSRVTSKNAYSLESFQRYYCQLDDNEIYEDELKELYDNLKRYVASKEDLEKHKADIRRKYRN